MVDLALSDEPASLRCCAVSAEFPVPEAVIIEIGVTIELGVVLLSRIFNLEIRFTLNTFRHGRMIPKLTGHQIQWADSAKRSQGPSLHGDHGA
ncbi:hypothetical protein J7E93_09420 [Streptomyces sp. ISL-36]|uniref:hypothetical protein n=1 Tax=Streptomyces sp. ISL-36 TaxID=2819182 RepID=UPI001BE89FD0|nr:hypothetical protein [Streptomyces sp. ISL-36]MBT2440324.1 hypothetical protein [Streptomyces sp. ISL-36]